MSISSEINRISQNVSDSLDAVAAKGVTVPSGSTSDDLPDLIASIPTGSGSGGIIISDTTDVAGGTVRTITATEITGTKTITENGTGIDVAGYQYVDVDVSGGGGTTYVTTFDEDMVMHAGSPGWAVFEYYLVPFVANQTYKVTFNGIEYICETQADIGEMNTYDGYFIGNASYAGGTNTGEPFLIARDAFGDTDPNHVQLAMDSYATGTVHVKIELAQSGGGTSWETIYDNSLNITLTDDYTYYYNTIPYSGNIEENSVWRVTWNGDQYLCTATSTGDPVGIPYAIGNDTIIHEQGGNDEPFFIQKIFANNDLYVFASQSQTVNLIIEKQVSSGAVLVPKTITQNGTYDPADDNADGYSEVTVNVQGSTSWETVYEGAVNLGNDWGNGYYYYNISSSLLSEPIPYGSVWRIVWDGVPYECTATEFVDTGGNPYCLGNCTYDGGQSGTEFPFFMQTYFSPNEWYVVGEQGSYGLTIQKQVSGGGGIDFPTFTVTMDSEYTTISSIVCDKTFSECEEIGNNQQYYAELEIHAGNNTFTSGAILTDIIEGQLVYSIGTTDVAWLIIRFNENGTITGTIDPIPYRDGSDITVSGATVTVPSGYYEQQETKTVASGTAGTPTATKGTVSNHSVSITPSVTNTTGYITGSTKTGTAVTVSASELVSGSQNITSNNTYNVTNLESVVVNVSGGSGIGTLLKTTSLGTISSSSTQAASLNISLEVTGINNYDLLIVESSVDSTTNNRHTATVGLIFLTAGSDIGTKNGATVATVKLNTKLSSNGTATSVAGTTAYGIYPNSCSISNGTASIPMYRRYNSTSTGTINGTYTARVYGVNLYDLIGG